MNFIFIFNIPEFMRARRLYLVFSFELRIKGVSRRCQYSKSIPFFSYIAQKFGFCKGAMNFISVNKIFKKRLMGIFIHRNNSTLHSFPQKYEIYQHSIRSILWISEKVRSFYYSRFHTSWSHLCKEKFWLSEIIIICCDWFQCAFFTSNNF